ncbi:MAG: hypothetical protein ACFFDI_26445 [Promethearchaeota archaeon]
MKNERELIEKAVELIKSWHNMNAMGKLPNEAIKRMWNIYYTTAPEMKDIREYLEHKK